jgi:hypothetical protein
MKADRLKHLAPGVFMLALSACNLPYGNASLPTPSASPSPVISPGPCTALEPAVGFPDVGVLRQSDNGKTACVHVGRFVLAVLEAPIDNLDTEQWQPMVSSDPSVATVDPGGDAAPPRGETRRIVKGVKPGVTVVSSTRPPCTSDSPSQCPPDQGWHVILVVSP